MAEAIVLALGEQFKQALLGGVGERQARGVPRSAAEPPRDTRGGESLATR